MKIRASLLDLGTCVSEAADLISPMVVDHHRRTAYLTDRIGRAMGLDDATLGRAVLAAAVHDIGAFSLGERLRALDFDVQNVEHAEPGYRLLREFEPFEQIASIVRYHHVEWREGAGRRVDGESVPDEAHLVFLADRIAVLFDPAHEPLAQVHGILSTIKAARGERFEPEAVAGFARAARGESFWFGLASGGSVLSPVAGAGLGIAEPVDVDLDQFARVLAHIVDFRSRYTATHSTGVAASAYALAGAMGMPDEDRDQIRAAGMLHDLGKLAVPNEVLDKPGRLEVEERRIVRAHSYHTGRILATVRDLSTLADWASHHHERLDGTGYPDHLSKAEITEGARLVAVSDVFTALSEPRPYRPALGRSRVLRSMDHMAHVRHIDGRMVEALRDTIDDVDAAREAAQSDARDSRDAVMLAEAG